MSKRNHDDVFIKPPKRRFFHAGSPDEELDDNWLEKSRKLQARRWHRLRGEIKGVSPGSHH